MTLPLLLSVPHAGLDVPPEIADRCILTPEQVAEDGDVGAAEIYRPLKGEVAAFVTTDVARAIVDQNRAEDDRRSDGIVKTHTCWNVPVYRDFPPEELVQRLLEAHYRPYHARLRELAGRAKLGVDGHTMAAKGPPVGPDPGVERPAVCLSNADGTCPPETMALLQRCFEESFEREVRVNDPFMGGYIIRSHAEELPWVQVELSRAPYLPDDEKRTRVLKALTLWARESA